MGRVILSGAGRKMTVPSVPISVMPVGSTVKLNVNGIATDFLIVNQGIPSNSGLYDSSCDGTWLLMKDIYENREWNSSTVNNLENSTILSYLNDPFLNLFDSDIRNTIKQVKIPYRKNGGLNGTDQSGANGLPCKIFPLGGYEVGLTTSDDSHFPIDGAKLSYFESGTSASANNKRIAYLNDSGAAWFLRSMYTAATNNVCLVSIGGGYTQVNASLSYGIRPALILPSTTLVDSNGMVIAPPAPPAPPVEYKANFADNDWATIIDACHKNNVPDTWVVRNQKTMTINGTDYAIDIIGKSHDDYADGSGKAPLTFQLHDCYGEKYAMNSIATNKGGWASCDMRLTHLPAIKRQMPIEVQNGIRKVKKMNSPSNLSDPFKITEDDLFLLGEFEVFGTAKYIYAGDGEKYEYYTDRESRIKNVNGVRSNWCERSPQKDDTTNFCSVLDSGSIYLDRATNLLGVSFGFCF